MPTVHDLETGCRKSKKAVWNGHEECAKLLVANDKGINNEAVRTSCINMVSCKGYTPLHLQCKDALPWATDILFLLLVAGADFTIRCTSEYLLPVEHARDQNKAEFVAILELFSNLKIYEENKEAREEQGVPPDKDLEALKVQISSKKLELSKKYAFPENELAEVTPWQADWPIPEFLFQKERVGSLPRGMTIHEHQIKPLLVEGFEDLDGIDSLHCLEFTGHQAEINRSRRERLLQMQDPEWKAPAKVTIANKIKVKTRNKRSGEDDLL